ncbi:MAG: hypothetical protein NTZ81_09300 [Actinobacteria bacterium]|nr:hypothetical protein [Actinomycetota bacterium]
MLASLQILLLTTVAASFAYWLLPAAWVEGRRAVLLVTSGTLLYIYDPAALFVAVGTVLLAWLLYGLTRRYPKYGWLPWLVVLPLVINAFTPIGDLIPFPGGSPRGVIFTNLATLGMSFYTFKLYASIKHGLKLNSLPFREILTTTLFYPAFPAGPIDASQKFDHAALSRDPDPRRWVMGVGRIGLGVFKIYIVGGYIQSTLAADVFGVPLPGVYAQGWSGPVEALIFAFFSFAFLYVNFSGFTDIAIGSGWMFNLELTENFHFPLLSHLSLVVTFTLIGLWHNVSVGYFFWGVGHGSALALTMYYRGLKRPPLPMPMIVRRAGGIVITLTFVSLMSTIANQPSNRDLARYVASFVGIQL